MEKKVLNKKKVFIAILIFFLIACIITLIILYKTNVSCMKFLDKYLFRKEIHENNLPYISLDSYNKNIYAYDKYIVLLDGNKLKLYNKYGKDEGEIEIEVSSPIFESNNNYLIVAEKNGKKMYCINNKNLSWQKDIEGQISSISINKNGYVSIIITGTSYKTVIKTFDNSGNELFTYYLDSTSIVDTDISNDNKYLAVAEINSVGIVVQSTIKIISIEDAKNNLPDSIKHTYIANSGDLITNINFQNRNNLICMYDSHIDVLSNGENKEIVNFKQENVIFASADLSSKIIKIQSTNNGLLKSTAEVQIQETNLNIVSKYSIDSTPKSLLVKDDMIVVNLGTTALFFKSNGWLQKEYESSHEILDILVCDNVAGIVSKNKIELISL